MKLAEFHKAAYVEEADPCEIRVDVGMQMCAFSSMFDPEVDIEDQKYSPSHLAIRSQAYCQHLGEE